MSVGKVLDCKVAGVWELAEITAINHKLRLVQVNKIWMQFSSDLIAPPNSQMSVCPMVFCSMSLLSHFLPRLSFRCHCPLWISSPLPLHSPLPPFLCHWSLAFAALSTPCNCHLQPVAATIPFLCCFHLSPFTTAISRPLPCPRPSFAAAISLPLDSTLLSFAAAPHSFATSQSIPLPLPSPFLCHLPVHSFAAALPFLIPTHSTFPKDGRDFIDVT